MGKNRWDVMSSNNPGSRNPLLMKDSGHTEWKPWAGIVEQKVLKGEQYLVACNTGVFMKDRKVFNVIFLGLPVTCSVDRLP